MDADTKKREAGCTCHQEEGDSECVLHDPPTCKRCGCEYTMKWPDTEPTKYCDACAHAVVEAAEARAEKAEGELAEARRQLGEVSRELEGTRLVSDAEREYRLEVMRERDALKAGKWAGPWRTHDDPVNTCILAWRDGMRLHGHAATITCGATEPSYIWWRTPTFRGVDGVLVDSLDAAKAAADAHLIAEGWFLAGGPHGAGEAK